MSMKNKLIAMTIALSCVCTSNVMAAVTQTEYDKDFSANTITVTGNAAKGEQISVHIVKNGEISESTIEEKSVYANQTVVGDNGEFCFVAVVRDSGKYNVFVSSEDLTANPVKLSTSPIDFYNSTDYGLDISQLNLDLAQPTDDAFCDTVSEKAVELGFDDEINNIIDINKIAKVMYQGMKDKALPTDKYKDNQNYYKNCALIVAANEGKLTSIYDYASNIIDNNPNLSKYWRQYITSEEKELYAAKKLYNKNLNDVNNLEKNISEVLLLTATRYPNGYMSLKDLYSDFKDILGISSVSNKSSVYSELAGKDYDDIDDLADAYEDAPKGPTGGSGNVGGNSGISLGGNSIQGISGEGTTLPVEKIPLNFIDLGSVRWAYPSISVLFDMGIVSGVNDTEFLPEREVKREEFTKMLVMAMGEDIQQYESAFSDVQADAWYANYVGCAYSKGIINGISSTEFGVSMNITRQDMAVMIYRAMLANGYNPTSSSLEFSDKDSVSGYALEAVAELSKIGVISGRGDNMFAPQKTATRAEAAVVIERALQYLR